MSRPVGTFCLVLHSHLPWLSHGGHWPVGEEWLHQAWAGAYGPVLDVLDRLADEGRTDLLTLGVTPVLHAMLDDPYSLRSHQEWLGWWLVRAQGAGVDGVGVAGYEGGLARAALSRFETQFTNGLSPVLRSLRDRSAIEILGGPAAHPFQPRQDPALTGFQLDVGLDDHRLRLGSRPDGIWAPECAYVPGLERIYAQVGVQRFMVDGPTVHGETGHVYDVDGSGVLAFPRDLEVTYRVWSPRAGYPGSGPYRDFHTFDHPSGLRPSRVTSKSTEPHDKKAYDPDLARAQADRDAADFVSRVRTRLLEGGERSLVVAGYDTELFGHWWHEGPYWLEQVLRELPQAGVRVTTLGGALEHVDVVSAPIEAGSWGRGKDFRVWDSPLVADIAATDAEVGEQLIRAVRKHSGPGTGQLRNAALDQLARETILATQSDWAFMVTGDAAADYARGRVHHHAERAGRLAALIEREDWERALPLASSLRETAGPFGHLDARGLAAWSESCAS